MDLRGLLTLRHGILCFIEQLPVDLDLLILRQGDQSVRVCRDPDVPNDPSLRLLPIARHFAVRRLDGRLRPVELIHQLGFEPDGFVAWR